MKAAVYGYWTKDGLAAEGEVVMLPVKQMQALELLIEGRTNDEIAETMGISLQTAKNYISSLMDDTDSSNRTQVAVKVVTGRIKLAKSPFVRTPHDIKDLKARIEA